MENKMTANEFLKDSNLKVVFNSGPPNLETIMIEFAKMHVKAALLEASEKSKTESAYGFERVNKKSILNAYSLENIV